MPTPAHVEALLTHIGIPKEDVSKIDSLTEEELKTFDFKPYADKVKTNYQTQLQNDPAFFSDLTLEKLPADIKKKLESGQYARATNVAKEKLVKALGFTAEEIKDLESDDYKSLDYYIPALAEKYTKLKAGDKETQQQLIEARKQLEKYGPDFEKEIETKHEKLANEKINSALFRANLIGELSSIPGLKIPAADIAKAAEDILSGKYSFERVGDFSIELRQKANPQMKVLKDNSSHELTLKEALEAIATERGWIDAEKKDDKGSGKIKVETGKDGKLHAIAPHVQDKISKKIAAEG
jgi:hypothetical protein